MSEIPTILDDYLNYMEFIKGISSNTTKEYFLDLRTFFKFLKIRYGLIDRKTEFRDIDIEDVDIELIKKVTIQDLHSYISYVDRKRNNKNLTKSRKVASLRSFFDYLYSKLKLIDENPALQLESPKSNSRLPVYLTLEQSNELLNAALANKNEEYSKRDYAIIMIFLNCGLRLSELSSIDINKIKDDDTLTVIGKGNKERTIFLNNACSEAIDDYLIVRPKKTKDNKALFISKQKNRLSNRAIQHMIDKYLKEIGLDTSIYSTHKLRHTAATLMYKYGNVDIRALQEILGHESVATTQIYTHIDNDRLRDAVKSNPLSNRKK
ncbi:MAG: tyrosine recombinase XerC [Tissierella sp.]|uniref:tyrosine recombinase XerC n=1 Tax=Tissierella sp. TaxID=41274 RepID=UPI003F946E25